MNSEESTIPNQAGKAVPTAPFAWGNLQNAMPAATAEAGDEADRAVIEEREGDPSAGQPHVMDSEEIMTPDMAANTSGDAMPRASGAVSMLQDLTGSSVANVKAKASEINGDDERSLEIITNDAVDADPVAIPAGPTPQNPISPVVPNTEHEENTNGEHGGVESGFDEDNDEDDSEVELDEEDEDKTCHHERRSKRTKPIPSLLQLAEIGILKQLTKAVDGQRVTARYCCGGRVRSLPPATLTIFQDEKPRKVSRLIMRWDDLEDKMSRKVHFPFNDSQSFSKFDTQIETLAKRCEATGMLDESCFSINFDPHYYGIIDVITQVLLPGFEAEMLKRVPEHRGVRAKLSNIQVRSAGGVADRPLPPHRSAQYFGKLIVNLPYAHKGGKWEVSSDGHSTSFDFSQSEDITTIHWAAFVGDCDHECQPVEEGHQLMLTYNLFLSHRVGEVLRDNPTADPTLLPLYGGVKEMLEHPGFMKKGGFLGFYCQYPYHHVSANAAKQLPSILQGVDMAFYSVFKSLGLKTEILPLLDISPLEEMDEMEYEREEEYYHEYQYDRDESDDDYPSCGCCIPAFPNFEEWKAKRPKYDRIGTRLHAMKFAESGEEADWSREEKEEVLQDVWPWKELEGVKWLNAPNSKPHSSGKGWEVALVNNSCCDHDVSTETFYSHPVILITVPKLVDRELTVGK